MLAFPDIYPVLMFRLFSSLTGCPACGLRTAGPAGVCGACLPHLFEQVIQPGLTALGRFDGPLAAVVRSLKYRGYTRLARPLGSELARQVKRRGWRPSAVTAVPLHPGRQSERGYNQAELLARSCADVLGIPFLQLLVRHRATKQQASLGTMQRHGNSSRAFNLSQAAPKVLPARVLIVDDVLTTGNTVMACRRELLAAGCEQVYTAAVAVASPKPAPQRIEPDMAEQPVIRGQT